MSKERRSVQSVNGMPILEFSPMVRPAVIENERRTFRCNALHIKNSGTVRCRIDDEYTLDPGEVLNLGSQTDVNLLVAEIHFMFSGGSLIEGEVAVKRVEIIEMHGHDKVLANYREKA